MRPLFYARKARSGRGHREDDLPVAVNMVDFGGTGSDDAYEGGGLPTKETEGRGEDVVGYGGVVRDGSQAGSQPLDRSRRSPALQHITADRPIFTLSVAADLLGLHPRTLRIYEEKKLVVPSRTGGNRRRYSQIDIEKLQAIRLLTRGGVNLEGVRIILEMSTELLRLGGDPNGIIEHNLQATDDLEDL